MTASSPAVFVEVTDQPLHLQTLVDKVASERAGAIATFSGVTRNNFEGQTVEKLEYEAYIPMAQKKLEEVCQLALQRWELLGIAIVHRLGLVKIGEASIVIAASSAHRRAALEACHWVIDELKAVVPIWKKEYYADKSIWKENAESRQKQC